MIVADIEHLNCLPHLKNIIERVISSDLANLSPGEHVIQGKSLYINRVSGKSRHITESKSEIHRDYIDIHLILSGHETIGYQTFPATEEFMSCSTFSNDCELIEQIDDEQFITISDGQLVVFYPGTWHRPMLTVNSPIQLEKVVIKIHKNYLIETISH